MRRTPLVGLPSDRKQIGHHPFQAVGEKYIRAVVDGAGCLPLLIPSLAPPLDLRALLQNLDGLPVLLHRRDPDAGLRERQREQPAAAVQVEHLGESSCLHHQVHQQARGAHVGLKERRRRNEI